MNKEKTDKIYNSITSNGCREMDEERFHQAVNELLGEEKERESEKQYCRNESNGGYRCIAPSFCPECRTKFEPTKS